MSRNDWMRGTITLPTAEVARVRKVLNDAHDARREGIERQVARLWELVKAKPAAKRYEWLSSTKNYFAVYPDEMQPTVKAWRGYESHDTPAKQHLREHASNAMHLFYVSGGRKPTAAHYDRAGLAPATNRRAKWRDGTLHVSLSGRELTVEAEGNHGVSAAVESLVGTALFGYLDRITWTARSGGEIIGNDEYNRDADYEGGGANYAVYRYESATARARREKAEARYWRELAL